MADVVKQEVAHGSGGRVIIVDSITRLTPEDAGAIVVSGSHGGTSAGKFALAVPLAAVFFNDGGVGKDRAGIAALDMLQASGIAAGAVAHTSARIGDAQDAWDNGILSHVNAAARASGLAPGDRLGAALAGIVARAAGVPDPTAAGRHAGGALPEPYYRPDLAWIHHVGYAHHVRKVHAGIVELLRTAGLSTGSHVLDVGCGSGLLARELLAAGFTVHGVDASPAMIDLAREYAPAATFDVLPLPVRAVVDLAVDAARGPSTAGESGLPQADAIVSTGHVLNYLDSRGAIAQALTDLALALRPGGVLAIDLMTEAYCAARNFGDVHAKVEDDWAIITRFSRPATFRFDRDLAVFRRVDGQWRRSDERHRNVTFDGDDAVRVLHDCGVDAQVRQSFGTETLPTGMTVVTGIRKRGSD